MLKISEGANPNYLAKIVALKGVSKHPNADKLQVVNVDFNTVITGLDAKDGDLYVYFPLESTINLEYLAQTNSFREKELNSDVTQAGFFEKHGRVKAIRLRNEKSMGYIVPLKTIEDFTTTSLSKSVGEEFDTVNGILLLKKYEAKVKGGANSRQGKEPKLSRLVEGQIHLHIDTEQLKRNIDKINPQDTISVTYKTHGTSWWVSNVIVKRQLNWFERILKKVGVNVLENEYDFIYGSRRVVKNSNVEDPKSKDHFYGYDLWEDIKDKVKENLPKGFTLYGEALGYDKNGRMIQRGYDYGCKQGEMKLEVYRITQTNPDGLVTELSYPQIEEFCTKANLTPALKFFVGKAKDMYPQINVPQEVGVWRERFLEKLIEDYNEKDCFMCINPVPEEGIVLRKEALFSCDSFKLKSFSFLERETKELDEGVVDTESDN